MDQTTMMALAATGVAVVGAAVLYATQSTPPAATAKKASKKKGKKAKKSRKSAGMPPPAPEPVPEDDATEEEAPAPAKKKSKKKKRSHKGRKRKGGNSSGGKALAEEDQGKFTRISKNESEGDEWSEVKAKPKKTRSNRKAATSESEDEGAQPKREKLPQVQMEVDDAVPAIIGKGGKTIQGLQESTGARLSIPRGTSVLTITGTPEQIALAKKKVEEIIAQRSARDSQFAARAAPAHVVTINDLGDAIGMVIGKGGSTIKSIEAETGAKMDISREDDSLTISGEKVDVEAAQERVNAIIASRKERSEGGGGGQRGARPPMVGGASAVIDLESRRGVFAVIGRGGAKVRQIEQESGARVGIDKENNMCTINGTDEQVEMASDMVKAVMASSVQSTVRMELTKANVGSVIGRGGSTIRRISDETGARLDISRGDDLHLKISGSDEAVAAAQQQVEAVLAAANESRPGGGRGQPKEGEIELSIDLGTSVGSVIGRGGETIRKIQETSGAKLNIERPGSMCRIVGTEEAVEAAKTQVEEILKRQSDRAARDAQRAAPSEAPAEVTDGAGADWSAEGGAGW